MYIGNTVLSIHRHYVITFKKFNSKITIKISVRIHSLNKVDKLISLKDWFFKKIKHKIPYPAMPLMDINTQESKAGAEMDICTSVFIAAHS